MARLNSGLICSFLFVSSFTVFEDPLGNHGRVVALYSRSAHSRLQYGYIEIFLTNFSLSRAILRVCHLKLSSTISNASKLRMLSLSCSLCSLCLWNLRPHFLYNFLRICLMISSFYFRSLLMFLMFLRDCPPCVRTTTLLHWLKEHPR